MAAWLGHFLSIWLGTDAVWSGMINMIKGDVTAGTDVDIDVGTDVDIDAVLTLATVLASKVIWPPDLLRRS